MKVIKRDGSIEDFNQNKIARVVKAAGLNDNRAQKLAKKVAEWLEAKKQAQVTSLQIRDKVIEELQKVDKYAANLFVSYQKTKEPKK